MDGIDGFDQFAAIDPQYQAYLAEQTQYSNPGASLVDPNAGNAQTVAANLINAQYATWQKNFEPYELSTLQQSSINNPKVLTDQVDQAASQTQATTQAVQGAQGRQLSGLGVKPTATQAADISRINDLSAAANTAQAKNQARANVANQDEMLALGGAPKLAT